MTENKIVWDGREDTMFYNANIEEENHFQGLQPKEFHESKMGVIEWKGTERGCGVFEDFAHSRVAMAVVECDIESQKFRRPVSAHKRNLHG